MSDKLLVATSTFICVRDGRRVTVKAGKTRVRDSDPIVKGREHLFSPVDGYEDLVEDTTARPGQKRGGRRRQDRPEEAKPEAAAKKPEADKG